MLKNNTSGVKGVIYNKKNNKYRAFIRAGKRIHLGYFRNKYEAAKARLSAEIKYGFCNPLIQSSAEIYIKKMEA
jgi:hypothetical protein